MMVESSELSSLLFCTNGDGADVDPALQFDFVPDGCKNLKLNKLYHFKDAESGL